MANAFGLTVKVINQTGQIFHTQIKSLGEVDHLESVGPGKTITVERTNFYFIDMRMTYLIHLQKNQRKMYSGKFSDIKSLMETMPNFKKHGLKITSNKADYTVLIKKVNNSYETEEISNGPCEGLETNARFTENIEMKNSKKVKDEKIILLIYRYIFYSLNFK